MFQTSQWVQVRPGASGSSTIKARVLTVLGRFSMRRGGFVFESSQVYFLGIFPPSENALLVTLREAAAGADAFSVCAELLASDSTTNKKDPIIAFIKMHCHFLIVPAQPEGRLFIMKRILHLKLRSVPIVEHSHNPTTSTPKAGRHSKCNSFACVVECGGAPPLFVVAPNTLSRQRAVETITLSGHRTA